MRDTTLANRFYARVFALVGIALLGYGLWRILSPFFTAILWATLISYMMSPLNRRLLARWKRPTVVSGVLTAATGLVIAGPVTLFLFAFVQQARQLLQTFQAEAAERKLPFLQLVLEFRPVAALLDMASEYASLDKDQVLTEATNLAQQVLQRLAGMSGTLVVGALQSVTQFALTMFLLFFFLRDGAEMVALAGRLVPLSQARKSELGANLGGVTRAVVLGTAVTAAVQGTLLGIGFRIAGLPSPLVFGAVGALVSLVPIVGTALLWVPAVITLAVQGETGMAIFLALWCVILVAGADNVLRPLIVSGTSGASTLLVFMGVLGGISAFGFAGIFMGPLLLTLAAAFLRYADESRVGLVSIFSGGDRAEPVTEPPGPPPSAPKSEPAAVGKKSEAPAAKAEAPASPKSEPAGG